MSRVRRRSESSDLDLVLYEKVKIIPWFGDARVRQQLEDLEHSLESAEALNVELEKEVERLERVVDEQEQELNELMNGESQALIEEQKRHNNTYRRLEKKYVAIAELKTRITELEVELKVERLHRPANSLPDGHGCDATSTFDPLPPRIDRCSESDNQAQIVLPNQSDHVSESRTYLPCNEFDVTNSCTPHSESDFFASEASVLRGMIAIAEYGKLSYPLDAPDDGWFRRAFDYINVDLGLEYISLVGKWVEFERSHGWDKGKLIALPSKNRPDEVGRWIKDGRYKHTHSFVRAEFITSFSQRVWSWWNDLQPTSHSIDSRDQSSTFGQVTWKSLDHCGQNGWLSLLVCLKWWGHALPAECVSNMKEDWLEAVRTFSKALDGVLRSQNTE
ncbi:SERTA domain-containing protein 3 [Stygiomarasmius scandens]|uniref:SERTA domain-containing protein 3 n=1 Tax=Marasmiellus scandens TaxID=2682957 RepID=A0ABR1IML5_9AGAR